ncbi:response regulator [Amphritea sp. HPY]|uniref:response regulator n=1 Tax=Amphritea sp. HPY TaxID=3421652 RepID=UPI003D7EF17E
MTVQSIIILAARQVDIDECSALIRDEFSSIYSCKTIPVARELLEQHKSGFLIFNHDSLKESFNVHQTLFHLKKKSQASLYTTILLCKAVDADTAYKLVQKKVFDDYIIFKPLYDPHRLRLMIQSLSGIHSNSVSQKELEERLANLTAKAKVLYRALGESMSLSNDAREQVQTTYADLKDSVIEQVNSLPSQLASSGWQDAVKVLEPEVLQQRINDFTERRVNTQFEQSEDKLQQTMEHWAGGIKENIARATEFLDEATVDFDAGGKKILIVDDDEIYSSILKSILEEVGYAVTCEPNGEKGLHRMATLQPDQVLLDYKLPDMTGLNVLEKVKDSNLLKHIPIFLLTGHAESDLVKKSLQYGASGFIVKPANREAILLKLKDNSACNG